MNLDGWWVSLGVAVTVCSVLFAVRLVLNGMDEKGIWPVDEESFEFLDWFSKMSAGSVLTVVGQRIRVPNVRGKQP